MTREEELKRQQNHPAYRALSTIEEQLTEIRVRREQLIEAENDARTEIKAALNTLADHLSKYSLPFPSEVDLNRSTLRIDEEWWEARDILSAVKLQPDGPDIWELTRTVIAAEEASQNPDQLQNASTTA